MKVKANVLGKSSFANLVYFLVKKIVFIPFTIVITLLLAVCGGGQIIRKNKRQLSFNFSAIQSLTQFTRKFQVWVCVWGGVCSSFPYLSYWFLELFQKIAERFRWTLRAWVFLELCWREGLSSFLSLFPVRIKGKQDCCLKF